MKRDVLEVACALANAWMGERKSQKLVNAMTPQFERLLDELDRATQGQPSRCFCITGRDSHGREHGLSCPASRR